MRSRNRGVPGEKSVLRRHCKGLVIGANSSSHFYHFELTPSGTVCWRGLFDVPEALGVGVGTT